MTQDPMKTPSAQKSEHDTKSHGAPPAHKKADKPQTYQESLDEAIEETFPASDPISPSRPHHSSRPVSTHKNPVDWQVKAHRNKSGKS